MTEAPQQNSTARPLTAAGRYCLITPCRDEAQYARRTLDSIINQTVLPALWVIVDDGSTDQTPQIVEEYAAKYPWIRVVRRADRGARKVGGGVVDAFYAGYATINPDDFEYVCKLDLDLDIPPKYFYRMIQRMEASPRLATCSGKPYMQFHGRLISEKCGDENSVGMIKFYRVSAFRQIGGFVPMVMWDGIDCHRCRMLGWQVGSWDEPETRFVHLRPMGTSHKNWWTGRVRHGVGQHFMGTGFLYMFASCVFRLFHPPMILGSIAMMWGWLRSRVQRAPRYDDLEFRASLRRYQRSCLLIGKRAATAATERRHAAVWKPD
ncbi:MAG: glycosyltransferase family 2 protein [Burkholderiales bacterium]|nr:glycosyltransferase family 2 protein [Phycisphaerae bacterium]